MLYNYIYYSSTILYYSFKLIIHLFSSMTYSNNLANEPGYVVKYYDPKELPENYHTFNGEIYQARYAAGVAAGMKLRAMIDAGELRPEDAKVGYVAANNSAEVVSGYTDPYISPPAKRLRRLRGRVSSPLRGG